MNPASPLAVVMGLLLAPLLFGVTNRVKARFAGRTGAPAFQPYFDLARLLRKGAVYSRTTTWVFRAGPVVTLAAVATALLMTPLGAVPAPVAFAGDFLLLLYLLGLARFLTMAAALDAGSSFEGMGASREGWFAVFAEPVLLVGLAALARHAAGGGSLSAVYGALTPADWSSHAAMLALLLTAFLAVFLAENARLPVDDPNTHLELTMIHEVMVLDHGGPDFGLIQYAAALKFWVLGAFVVGLALPLRGVPPWAALAAGVAGQFALAAAVGVVESVMARLRLMRVPQLLLGAGALAGLALLLTLVNA